ncbi:hypothetical protein KP509_37G024300 [Ceratopteris richardii]|uniref:Uncharacterized protein n=1 Tax=Ceratopteris richardii TaxID=49495 RepID=A0A8T2Q7E8_CERRI|nr:hypothetical protein KP509_37G024300 [Ceratopteris richardii]KAH7279556.1 hypothetical protein KP509_37G024300 [Ceratopteris richardii]KAH7279560.1 hypothetical protein KP509_37G024300 [Ceratopteris richardii]
MEALNSRHLDQKLLRNQMLSSSCSSWSPCEPRFPDSCVEIPIRSDDGHAQRRSDDEEEVFGDPVLQYINDILMGEDDLEGRNCMLLEGMCHMKDVYMKELSEIIRRNEGLSALESQKDFNRSSLQNVAYAQKSYAHTQSLVDYPLYEDAAAPCLETTSQNGGTYVEFPAYEDGSCKITVDPSILNSSRPFIETESQPSISNHQEDDHKWIEDVINNLSADISHVDESAGLSPSSVHSGISNLDIDNPRQMHNSSQVSMDSSSSMHEQDSFIKSDTRTSGSVLADSTRFDFLGTSGSTELSPNRKNEHTATIGRTLKDSSWHYNDSETVSSFTSGTLQDRQSSVGANSRSKRTAEVLNATDVSSSSSFPSSTLTGEMVEDNGENEISYVENENLGAEKCGKVLSGGIGLFSCRSSSKSSLHGRKELGRAKLIVSTVADLKGLLLSCAQAVASNNLQRAHEILREIRQDASPYGSGWQRLAHYFAEGLVARLSGTGDRLYSIFRCNSPSAAKLLKAHHLYVEVCPYVRISHYFANKAILEAAKGATRLHIIDYGILYGVQWPCLISALSQRKGGPPMLRITGIDFPQPGNASAERVEMTGKRLSEYAGTYGVPFEYCAIAKRWETIEPSELSLSSREDEVVIVNSMCRLRHLLDETVLPSNPRKTVLSKIREINPKIFIQGIRNGNYNIPFFLSRFKEALISFSGQFDMFETLTRADNQERLMIEKEVLGRDILNVIACEGTERIERPETYRQWQNRTRRAGFVQVPLDRNMLEDSRTIIRCRYNKNFLVDEDGSWMLLSWKGKVSNALSLWKPA